MSWGLEQQIKELRAALQEIANLKESFPYGPKVIEHLFWRAKQIAKKALEGK